MTREPQSDTTFKFRCLKADLKAWKAQAEREGFGGNVSAWLLWHLRRIVRENEGKKKR
jgi:hypothetical protein